MTVEEARALAAELLSQLGFPSPRMVATLGMALFQGKTPIVLRLSEHHVLKASDADVLDVILHEIAHFVAGAEAGHGPAWKRACLRVGARPERLFTAGQSEPPPRLVSAN